MSRWHIRGGGPDDVRAAAYATGRKTLDAQARAHGLNAWMYSKFARRIAGDVLELGSGMGTMSRLIAEDARSLVATDVEDTYLRHLRARFAGSAHVEVARFDLEAPTPPTLRARRFDTVVSSNVIEHIRDDARAVRALSSLLRPGGWMLSYVPACEWAYGGVDAGLGHYRRYDKATFSALMRNAGLEVRRLEYMNLVGLLGWWFNGRVLRRRVVSERQTRAFERFVPLARLEDSLPVPLPVGLGIIAHAQKPG